MADRAFVIRARQLFDGTKFRDDLDVVCEGERIVEVRAAQGSADFEGIVTPCFIDAHSHIGQARAGEPSAEDECNEHLGHLHPLVNPLNSVYFDDRAFEEAVDFGVLYSCIVPGSGNLIGGRAMVVRNFARNRSEALVKDYGFKMALGYNPRSVTEWGGERPSTRMGVYEMLERRFDEVLRRKRQSDLAKQRRLADFEKEVHDAPQWWNPARIAARRELITEENKLELGSEERALLELLSGKKAAKVHVHREDDVHYLIELSRKYGLSVTAEHLCDIHRAEVFEALSREGIPIVYGPLGSHPYKVELKHETYRNVRALLSSKAFFGLMTDHPVILTPGLRESLKFLLIQGMGEAEALSVITSRNARILGIEKDVGTVEPGRLASLVVWNCSPLHLGAYPTLVMAEGKVVRREGKAVS